MYTYVTYRARDESKKQMLDQRKEDVGFLQSLILRDTVSSYVV